MSIPIDPIPAWTVKDMCVATGLSRQTVIKYIEQGVLPGMRLPGGQYRIPALQALAWMKGEWKPEAANITPITPQSLIRRIA